MQRGHSNSSLELSHVDTTMVLRESNHQNDADGREVGIASVLNSLQVGHRMIDDVKQILTVGVGERSRHLAQLLTGDEVFAESDFLDAGDFESLAGFDSLDEVGG